MYTQCPECATAFRVTAEILKQAGGEVRCGSCSNAFNALMYLSETKPAKSQGNRDREDGEAPPRLDPEPDDQVEAPPRAITPEQSEALLRTLDDLSGADIRLEDTGVEWRLMYGDDEYRDDDNEAPEIFATGVKSLDEELDDAAGAAQVDELLEDSPTPIDQFLTNTPHDIEAPEVFANPEDSGKHKVDAREVFENAAEEMRFDDNTGLPDDFDFDSVPSKPAPVPVSDPSPSADTDEEQVDISFGDEDEWGALLDEVDEAAATAEPEAETNQPSVAPPIGDELDAFSGDEADDEPDGPPDIDTQFDLQAEALGIETDRNAGDADEADAGARRGGPEVAGLPSDPDPGESSIEEDLISAAFESEAAREDMTEVAIPDSTGELEIELAKAQALLDEGEEADPAADADEDAVDNGDGRGLSGELEPADEEEASEFDDLPPEEDESPAEPDDDDFALFDDLDAEDTETADVDTEGDEEFELILDETGSEPDAAASSDDEPALPEHVVPPPTDEEQTINMMIDEDLLRMAVEDTDGLSSTMVLKGDEAQAADDGLPDDVDAGPSGPGVETIIMEGEFVRTALEEEALRNAENDKPDDPFIEAAKRTMQAYKPESGKSGGSRRNGLVAGIAGLGLLLVGQIVHQSRAELATIPAVNGIIAPIYRAVGHPITPEWNVTGWRFEVSRGSTNPAGLAAELAEAGAVKGLDQEQASGDNFADPAAEGGGAAEVLTIYSRIGNRSADPLPYPLISVALVDRYEETIGSKVLQPGDYLTGDADPRELVPPGETFNAVMSIRSPAPEATGFKLNVCYRLATDQLRCALEDFK